MKDVWLIKFVKILSHIIWISYVATYNVVCMIHTDVLSSCIVNIG